MSRPRFAGLFTPLVAFTFFAAFASADPRPFTFTYDTYPEGKGNVEFEQWLTWENGKPSEHGANAFRLREEFEFGLADNFDLSVYVANWRYEDARDFTGTRYESSGVEGILYLSNPVTDPVGVALYGEVDIGEHDADFEGKLLLHKDIGPWTLAYNFILETEIEGIFSNKEENEVDGVLGHALGVSYSLTPKLRVGAEVTVESLYGNWSKYEGTTVYAGPTVAYTFNDHAWIAVTPAFQLTNTEDEPKFQGRVIFGWQF